MAVAAAVVLTISATAVLWSKVNRGGGVDSGARPQPTAAARPIQTPLKQAPLPPSIKPTVAEAPAGGQKKDSIGNLAHQTPAPVSKRKPRVSLPAVQESIETATDYFPLTAVAQTESAEIQQVVRVEVPRSMLATWGVPVSADRTRTSIKADLVIGEDGVARAIRLVN
jgi:hypothetical protein